MEMVGAGWEKQEMEMVKQEMEMGMETIGNGNGKTGNGIVNNSQW